jgi:hypothetical protein
MKHRSLLVLLFLATAVLGARASIDYSGIQDIPIPLTFEGVYFRLDTGATSTTLPADFNTAPWLNPIFGGVGIGNSPLLRPIITGTDQILNLAPGTVIDATSNFLGGASGSSTHVGTGAGQFLLGTPGYLGAAFQSSVGGPEYFGWIRLELNNAGAGRIISWAVEDVSGAPIQVGAIGTAVPEPGTALSGLVMVLVTFGRRMRSRP